jgi:hypothetical protein
MKNFAVYADNTVRPAERVTGDQKPPAASKQVRISTPNPMHHMG